VINSDLISRNISEIQYDTVHELNMNTTNPAQELKVTDVDENSTSESARNKTKGVYEKVLETTQLAPCTVLIQITHLEQSTVSTVCRAFMAMSC